MNWYKKASKSFKLDSLTRIITKDIILCLKNEGSSKRAEYKNYAINNKPLLLEFQLIRFGNFSIGAAYNPFINRIRIDMHIDIETYRNLNKNLKNIYIYTYKSVKHELEHWLQMKNDNKSFNNYYEKGIQNKYEDLFKYLSQEVEKQAFVSEAYSVAKKSKISLRDVFKNTIMKYINGISNYYRKDKIEFENKFGSIENNVNKLINEYYDYARKRYHLDTQPNKVVQFKPSTELVESK